MKLHLLDATYELFRAYHALPSMKASDGREAGAVYGLLNTAIKLLKEPGVTHVACATDTTVLSFRNELFAGYKTGDGVPADLLGQFPLAEEGLEALGLVVWRMERFEADDALATAAARWGDEVEQVLVCTPDKDLAQCVRDEQVVLCDRRREIVYDEPGVRAKWGVNPTQIPDYLALIGDAADGLPGIPGWGPKSTATVLGRYGAIEEIPASAADWDVKVRGAQRLADTLRERREDALLYKRLATLRTDVPLSEDLPALEYRGTDKVAFQDFCARMSYARIADRAPRWR